MMEREDVRRYQQPTEENSGPSQIVPSTYRVQRALRVPFQEDQKDAKIDTPCAAIDVQAGRKNDKPYLGGSAVNGQTTPLKPFDPNSTRYVSLSEKPATVGKFLNDEETEWGRLGVEYVPPSPLPEDSWENNQFECVDKVVPGKVVYGDSEVLGELLCNRNLYEEDTGVVCIRKKMTVNKWKYKKGENFEEPLPLGNGTFGHVSFTSDKVSASTMVCKEINLKKMEINPNEVLIPLSLKHRSVISIWGCIIRKTKILEIFMEFGGFSFDKVVDDENMRKLLVEPAIVDIGRQGYQVLDVLQKEGIMHLDIKPQNLLLYWDERRAFFHMKVCDFGAARRNGDPIVPRAWTPAYMAPEQCRFALCLVEEKLHSNWSHGETAITPQADVYSLASSLLFLCYWFHCIPKLFPTCQSMQLICEIAMEPSALQTFVQDSWNPDLKEVLRRSFCGNPLERITPLEATNLLAGTSATPAPPNSSVRRAKKRKPDDERVIESMEVEYVQPCKKPMCSPVEQMEEGHFPEVEPQLDTPPPGAPDPSGNLPLLGILLDEA